MILCIMIYTLCYTLTISVKIILYCLCKGNVTRPRILKFGRYRAYSNFLIKFYTCFPTSYFNFLICSLPFILKMYDRNSNMAVKIVNSIFITRY